MDSLTPRPTPFPHRTTSFSRLVLGWLQSRQHRSLLLLRRLVLRVCPLVALLIVLLSGIVGQFAQASLDLAPTAFAASASGPLVSYTPNTLARFRATGNAGHPSPTSQVAPVQPAHVGTQQLQANQEQRPVSLPPSVGVPTAHPLSIPLTTSLVTSTLTSASVSSAASASSSSSSGSSPPTTHWYTTSDGTLSLGLPSQSINLGASLTAGPSANTGRPAINASTPHGPFTLAFTQTQGGHDGDIRQLAQFTLTVTDGTGRQMPGVGLSSPITIRLHYGKHELDGLNGNDVLLVWPQTGDQAKLVSSTSVKMTNDPSTDTLTATVPSLLAGPLVVQAPPTDANQDSSEHLANSGNPGDVQFSIPLDEPPAAGGFSPALNLTYSSALPNGRTDRSAPASWVGDGFNLSLGDITYDVTTGLYYLNNLEGISEPLLCCMVEDSSNHEYFVPDHHPDVRVYTSNYTETPAQQDDDASCFHVYFPNGDEYDLGCTRDSTHNTVNNGVNLALEWDVNHARHLGNTSTGALQQYQVTYWQDGSSSGGVGYSRGWGMGEIDYNFINGSPTAKITFNIHWPQANGTMLSGPGTATQYGTNYNCTGTPSPNSTTLRCDDPITPAGWMTAPLTMSTLTLDSVLMQVDVGGSWQTVRSYQFTYQDTPYGNNCWDPEGSGEQYACAGEHLLQSVQEIPYQNGSAEPSLQPVTFSYSAPVQNGFNDTTNLVNGNPYFAQTWWQYLTHITDKQSGLDETVSWALGHGNTNGVPSGESDTNPFTCNSGGCHQMDDRQWSRQVVTSITDVGISSSDTTTYAYTLNQACGTNCTQDYWIPPNGWNACGDSGLPPQNPNQACLGGTTTNYYDEVYMGMATVTEQHADGSNTVTQYYAGNGWGTNDWDQANALDGMPYQQDDYQGTWQGATPLEEVDTTYNLVRNACPDITPGNQLYQNPYLMCEPVATQQTTYVGGGSGSTVPALTQTWNYNLAATGSSSLNHYYETLTSSTVSGNDLLADSTNSSQYGSTQPTYTTTYSDEYHDGVLDSTPTAYYLLNLPAQVILSDSLGNGWACVHNHYDGQGYVLGQQSSLDDGLLTQANTYSSCGTSSNGYTLTGQVATATGFDTYGQPIVSLDADAVAGVASHVGCTPTTTPLVVSSNGHSTYTSCTSYDTTQEVYPTGTNDPYGDTTATGYDEVQGVPTSSTDANGQVTSYAGPDYEYSGSPSLSTFEDVYTQTALPGETYKDGGSSAWTQRDFTYSFCATAPDGQPCLEEDSVRQLDGNNPADLAVTRQFYDRDGRLIETRTNSPTDGNDLVTFMTYDDVNDKVFQSQACSVPALSTSNGGRSVSSTPGYIAPASASGSDGAWINPGQSGTGCSTVTGTTSYTDALGRPIASDDALGTGVGSSGTGCLVGSLHHTTCTSYAPVVASSVSGLPSTDTEPYLQTVTIDANLNQRATYTDAQGQTAYSQTFNGQSQTPLGSGVTSYAVSSAQYDPNGNQTQLKDAGGNLTTWVYDDLSRLLSVTTPDTGTTTYPSYDANGNMLESVDARGATGTVYAAYDGLNRLVSTSASNTQSSPFATYTYGTTSTGNNDAERLMSATFATGPSQEVTGSYSYSYDSRGRTTSSTFALSAPNTPAVNYTLGATYNDDDQLATLSIPAAGDQPAETLSATFDNSAGGLVKALSSSLSSPTNLLYNGLTYTSQGLLSGYQTGITGGSPGWQASYAFAYDGDLRPKSATFTRTNTTTQTNTTVWQVQAAYHAGGNLATLTTTLPTVGSTPGGTETQALCEDAQDRLVWASTQSTGPCGRTGSEGITGAGYTATYSYNNLDEITSASVVNGSGSPIAGAAQGTYTYDTNQAAGHVHGLSSVGSGSTGYSAGYDAAGEQICRALNSTTCTSANNTGQVLTYNPLQDLIGWQNTPSSPTATGAYADDGSGQRVWQQDSSTSGSTTTTTSIVYVLGIDQITTTAITSQQAKTTDQRTYALPGGGFALRDASGLNDLSSDLLGTPTATLNLSGGSITGAELLAPYGEVRYAASAPAAGQNTGTLDTTLGFTGQQADTTAPGSSGLDDFNARYYDPVVGVFTSADSIIGSDPLLDSYAYVGGMVEDATDPSGNLYDTELKGGGAGVGGAGAALLGLLGSIFGGEAAGVGATATIVGGAGAVAACEEETCLSDVRVLDTGTVSVQTTTSDGDEYTNNFSGNSAQGQSLITQINELPSEQEVLLQEETGSETARGRISQNLQNEFQENNGPVGTGGTSSSTTSGGSSPFSGNTYVADSNIFMDGTFNGANASEASALLNDPSVTLIVPDAVPDELAASPSQSQNARLAGTPGGAQIVRIPNPTLTPYQESLAGGSFDLNDARIVQAAQEQNVPVITYNSAMPRQIWGQGSSGARALMWGSVKFVTLPLP